MRYVWRRLGVETLKRTLKIEAIFSPPNFSIHLPVFVLLCPGSLQHETSQPYKIQISFIMHI